MVKSHTSEPSFQGTRGTHGDSNPKDWGSKASMGMYRSHQLSIGIGLPSKIPRRTNINSWWKLREEGAAKRELTFLVTKQRSQTKQAQALGLHGMNSCISPEQITSGVKRAPTEFVIRLPLRTLETFTPAKCEVMGEIGSKPMPRVMSGIDLMIDPKGCPLPVALLELDV